MVRSIFGWRGFLDEITLYNRALSLAEIQSINNAGINGKTKQAATNAGANSQTVVNDATITFDNVSTAGTTTDYTIAPATAGILPAGLYADRIGLRHLDDRRLFGQHSGLFQFARLDRED